MKYFIHISILFFGLMGISACSTNSNDETERTFPEAFDFEATTIQQLRDTVIAPDSLNLEAYVVSIISCPPRNACIVPDGIIVSDSMNPVLPKSKFMLTLENPLQFQKGRFYRFSLQIGTYPGSGQKRFELLGYSRQQQ